MKQEFDLLGDPIPDGHGKKGRPPHMPDDEKRRLIIQLAAFGRTNEQIAAALNCSEPTLRKHYFRELEHKEEARFRVEAKLLTGLMSEVEKGNVSAIGKYYARLDKADLNKQAVAMQTHAPKSNVKAMGKKEEILQKAEDVRGLFSTPDAPRLHS